MQYGNYSSSIIGKYLFKSAHDGLLESNKNNEVVTIAIKCDNSYDTYNNVSKYLSSENINILSKNYDEQSKTQRLAIANILVLIVSLFSLLVLIISLFVSKFKITEPIEEEITNMGVLKTLGYSSNEIASTTDYAKSMNVASTMYVSLVSAICIVIIIVISTMLIELILSKKIKKYQFIH